jgi:hypothetical protein
MGVTPSDWGIDATHMPGAVSHLPAAWGAGGQRAVKRPSKDCIRSSRKAKVVLEFERELATRAKVTCSVQAVFMTGKRMPVGLWEDGSMREHWHWQRHGNSRKPCARYLQRQKRPQAL